MGHHKELIRLHEYAEPGHCPAPHQLVAPMVAVRIAEFFGGQVELTFPPEPFLRIGEVPQASA